MNAATDTRTCNRCGRQIYKRADGRWATVLVEYEQTTFCPYDPDTEVGYSHDPHPFPIRTRVTGLHADGERYTGTVHSTSYDYRDDSWSVTVRTDRPFETPAGRSLNLLQVTHDDYSLQEA